jgi:hypothetical protein
MLNKATLYGGNIIEKPIQLIISLDDGKSYFKNKRVVETKSAILD